MFMDSLSLARAQLQTMAQLPIDQYNPDLYFSTVGKKMGSLFQRLKVFVQQYENLSRSITYPYGFREDALPCLWNNSWT